MIVPSAVIDPTAKIGAGTRIWAFAQIAQFASVGSDCMIANGVYIDRYVKIGNRVRVHNKALLYQGLVVEDDVFIGPGACFTNDPWPHSGETRNLEGVHWRIGRGASIGANVTVLPDISIGSFAVVGAGSLVSREVPPYALVYGNPARIHGLVCPCGHVFPLKKYPQSPKSLRCPKCKKGLP